MTLHRGVFATILSAFAHLAPAYGTPPVIVTDPAPQVGVLGGEVRLTVVATGDAPLTYRWRKDGNDLGDGATVSGASTRELLLSAITAGDAADYDVVVTSGPDSTTSLAAALTTRLPQGGDIDFSYRRRVAAVDALVLRPDGSAVIAGDFGTTPALNAGRVGQVSAQGSLSPLLTDTVGDLGRFFAMAMQPDGKLLIGGELIARFRPDGSRENFNGGGVGDIWAIALQPDGKILVGGDFTEVANTSRNRIARLNVDGTLDTTFLSGLPGANGSVRSIALQPDGKVLLGGTFTSVNGAARNHIARLNADGTLDTFLDGMPGANDAVLALGVQPDGRIVLGGEFTMVNGVGRGRIARLNADGTLDGFQDGTGGANETVLCLALQPDGKWLVGGAFDAMNGEPQGHLVRLLPDGTVDATYTAEASDTVGAIALDDTGGAWIGGVFERVNGVVRPSLARLDGSGGLRDGFASVWLVDIGAAVDFALQDDGRLLVSGPTREFPREPAGSLFRDLPDGTTDRSYAPSVAEAIELQPDGKVLLVSERSVRRTDAWGSPDPSFTSLQVARFNFAFILSLATQPDGRILIGGIFSHIGPPGSGTGPNATPRNALARLHPDGTLDTSFVTTGLSATASVRAIAVQPDGKVLIGMSAGVARLDSNGAFDPGFPNGPLGANGSVSALALQPDGKILLGGSFTSVNGVARGRMARLHPDGSLDTTFQDGILGASQFVNSIALQTDGKILIAGGFTSVHGVARKGLARLNPDGSLDTSFQCDALRSSTASVYTLALQSDARILLGGEFATVNGIPYAFVARLFSETPVAPTIAADPQDATSYDGCCAVFRVEAAGTPRDYRWRKGGIDLVDGGNVRGAATARLTLSGITAADAGEYDVVVSNLLGEATSVAATLTLDEVPQCQVVAGCDGSLGCVLSAAPEGSACSNGDACTSDSCAGGVCVGTPVNCDDQDACTADSCDPAAGCVHVSSGVDEPNPRTTGYWKRLCQGPHSGDALTGEDAACVASQGDTLDGLAGVEDLCAVLGQGGAGGTCGHAEIDLMALALNVCHLRVCGGNVIASQHGSNGTVGESYAEADAILSDPDRDHERCLAAKGLLEEINTGRALNLDTVALARLAGGNVRLSWQAPYGMEPVRYNAWRREAGSLAPFQKIGETATPAFDDATPGDFEYEVTPVR